MQHLDHGLSLLLGEGQNGNRTGRFFLQKLKAHVPVKGRPGHCQRLACAFLADVLRNVSIKMRHPGQEITLPRHQLKMGLLIQTASGKVGGVGILPLNLFGCFSYASANTVERRSKTSSAMQ
jgi:hypothetical protein